MPEFPSDGLDCISDDGVDDGTGGVLERLLLCGLPVDVDLGLQVDLLILVEDGLDPCFDELLD